MGGVEVGEVEEAEAASEADEAELVKNAALRLAGSKKRSQMSKYGDKS